MSRFDPSVLAPDTERRVRILDWLESGLAAVDPEEVTSNALADRAGERSIIIAIGKAAPAMSRGAGRRLELAGGVCVSDHSEVVPDGVELIVGNHPVPGPESYRAGARVLDVAAGTPAQTNLIALVSGGGSTLCELPRPGVPEAYLAEVNRRLVAGGVAIEEMNLVRSHLSAIKCGGVARAAGRPIDTFVLSDVAGADPAVVASGPTVPRDPDPEEALQIMTRLGIEIPAQVRAAVMVLPAPEMAPNVTVVADGMDAARAIAGAVAPPAEVRTEWLNGDVAEAVGRFLGDAGPGVTVGTGETVVDCREAGSGGRNTHAALLAAKHLVGTDDVFVAFATDGVDGASGSAGAIVDGTTIARGGDPARALAGFDSASYLEATSDLLKSGPTGTNVSDIWILWRRPPGLALE